MYNCISELGNFCSLNLFSRSPAHNLHFLSQLNPNFMSEYLGLNTYQSNSASANGSASSSTSPDSRARVLGNPIIKTEPAEKLIPKSGDIKKQLSQSLYGASGPSSSSGGISKPHSRKNSVIAMKSEEENDDEDDDEDGQGNERKRRDNINDRIQELLTLIPPEFFQETAPVAHTGNQAYDQEAEITAAVKNSGTKDGKPNKGQILTKSVEYLQYLQNLIDENNRKEVELIMKLRNLQGQPNTAPIGNTSAEKALGKIGVGPLSEPYFKQILVNSASASKSARRGSVG